MEKEQFDEYLGGNLRLPTSVHTLKLATARATEIAEMTRCLENPQQTKLIFQKLPAMMRRRVMSHNAKRMPRRLREGHTKQMEKAGLPAKTKTPSRKYRRRPQNLLSEYTRRQKVKFWTELHIWHAKRFKMSDKYGFKIAEYSNDRCFKANYRAIKDHCLIQDISYYTCLELRGPQSVLLKTLQSHCNPSKLTFGAKCWINGEREGSLMFYAKDKYPYCALGNMHFLWEYGSGDERAIWIWIHPANYHDVIREVISSFSFVIENEENPSLRETEAGLRKATWNDVNTMPPMMTIFRDVRTPSYSNDEGCYMKILRNELNRFRLRGPLALDVITDALKIPKFKSAANEERMVTDEEPSTSWFDEFYAEEKNARAFQVQNETFDAMGNQKPGNLPPNMVMGLTVLDPRFALPKKRVKACSYMPRDKMLLKPPTSANNSPLWNADLRKLAIKNFVASHEINKIRSECLVTGVGNDELLDEGIMRKVSIMLVQKPGNSGNPGSYGNTDSFSSGVDVIVPSNWAMPFWLSFILRNAKAAGSRESTMISFESSNLESPDYHPPDSPAYERESLNKKSLLTERYFRRPPQKRVNFIKYGVPDPFACRWKLLLAEWAGTSDYYVLRDRSKLLLLQQNLKSPQVVFQDLKGQFEADNVLVPVKIILERKGSPQDFASICFANDEDLERFEKEKNWSGPTQTLKEDLNEAFRKECRKKHKKAMIQRKRKLIRLRKAVESSDHPAEWLKKRQNIQAQILLSRKSGNMQYEANMRTSYLPKATHVRYSCDREVIGFIDKGAFSYSEAKGVGIGYVVLQSILQLLEKKQSLVLMRNTQSRYFRFARVEVLC